MTVATLWLEEGEPGVQLAIPDGSNDPFNVMIPEGLVEVVKDFDRKWLGRVQKGPIG